MKQAGAPIVPLLGIERRSKAPLYRQIYEGYREAIVDGRLRPGQRLPSTRGLADELGVSRLPVLNAFAQLLAEGYFESRVGAGTFVARSLPEDLLLARGRAAAGAPTPRSAPRSVSRQSDVVLRRPEPWLAGRGAFRVSQLALDHFPFGVWSSLVTRHARNPRASAFAYGDVMGLPALREAIATYLRTARAVRCEPEQIMVVSGSQQALAVSARVLLDPGSKAWIEEPGYPGARDALRLLGAELVPVPVDAEGLDVAAGMRLCPKAHAVYVTPSHQYPLGVTMSASRRLQLLEWARRAGSWIIEDDYDSEYRYGSPPIAALQGLDRDGRVVYTGTFSKVLFPSLRLGYIVVPRDLVPRFAAVREAIDLCPPSLSQAVLADFIAMGHFARHLRRMRVVYGERCAALVRALGRDRGAGARVLGDQAGIHLTVTLPAGTDDVATSERAAAEGLWALPLSTCYIGAEPAPGLVLGYGGTSVREIREAVPRLERLIALQQRRGPESHTS